MELARKLFKNKRLRGSPGPFVGWSYPGFFVSFLSTEKPGVNAGHIELAKSDLEYTTGSFEIT